MLEHKHILVVDDESQITRVLRTSLSSHGYDIRVANDGETALEIMKDWSPDLVITDLTMPNMDGLELCRQLRTKTQIPIIVLSVRGEERTKVKALDAGADDYVTKQVGDLLLATLAADVEVDDPALDGAGPVEGVGGGEVGERGGLHVDEDPLGEGRLELEHPIDRKSKRL